jgi:hypothetical protein
VLTGGDVMLLGLLAGVVALGDVRLDRFDKLRLVHDTAPSLGSASRNASRSDARISVFRPSFLAGSLPSRIKQ